MAAARGKVRLTGTLTVAGAALLLAAACVDGGAYVRENERLLETLPEVPGSQRLEVESSPYYLSDYELVDGYTTNVVYRAPPEMTAQEVIDFYVRSLEDDWEYELEEVPIIELPSEVPSPPFPDASPRPVAPDEEPEPIGSELLAHFIREKNTVSINTAGIDAGGADRFEVVVDHRGCEKADAALAGCTR